MKQFAVPLRKSLAWHRRFTVARAGIRTELPALYCARMHDHPASDILGVSPILQALSTASKQILLGVLVRHRYKRNEILFRQGDPGETVHLVRKGHLKIQVSAATGEEAVLTVVGPGELFGELTLLDGGPRSATVVALDDVETVALGRADFQKFLRQDPAVVEALLATLARTIRRLSDDVSELMFLNLRGRLARKLLDLAEIDEQVTDGPVEIGVVLTQEELASMIGATRPRVNRILGFFEDHGAIARRGRQIVIANPNMLRAWVTFPDEDP
jgi:CRP/FNR family transcriptional regulator, cyclic AMP receptor protein